VRVPVYVGELASIKADAPATVGVLGRGAKQPLLAAAPVAVPFSATANPLISELFYEVRAESAELRPGMKVEVSLTLQGSEESLVVPAAAILYDIHGNTWVYEALGAQAYTRRRVEVRRLVGPNAILARGPPVGAKMVTDGAAELFGTEFGAGK
jgi:multidrug efflux pump subunit AcrA (membrane-fusion protein)